MEVYRRKSKKTSGNKSGKDLSPLAKNEGREDSNK